MRVAHKYLENLIKSWLLFSFEQAQQEPGITDMTSAELHPHPWFSSQRLGFLKVLSFWPHVSQAADPVITSETHRWSWIWPTTNSTNHSQAILEFLLSKWSFENSFHKPNIWVYVWGSEYSSLIIHPPACSESHPLSCEVSTRWEKPRSKDQLHFGSKIR